jgi:hypothetical protein
MRPERARGADMRNFGLTENGTFRALLKDIEALADATTVLLPVLKLTRTFAIKRDEGRWEEDFPQRKITALFSRIEKQVKVRYIEVSAGEVVPAIRAAAWATKDVLWRRRGEPWPLSVIFIREENRVKASEFNKVHELDRKVLGWARNLGDRIYVNADQNLRDVPLTVGHEIGHILPREELAEKEADADFFAEQFVGAFMSDIKVLAASYLKI